MASSDRGVWVKQNGTWIYNAIPSFNVNGNWKTALAGWYNAGGTWKQFWPQTGAVLFETSTTWTVPRGVHFVTVTMCGGGGGGGTGRRGDNGGGGGGGGGQVVQIPQVIVNHDTTYSIVIGKGGSGSPANTGTRGAAGDPTKIIAPDNTELTAWGGGGGGGIYEPPLASPGGGGGGGASCGDTGTQGGGPGAAQGGSGWTNWHWDLGGGGGGSNFDAKNVSVTILTPSTNSAYSGWLNTYGVWNDDINSPDFDQSFIIKTTTTGNYQILGSFDNLGEVYIDGHLLISQTDAIGYRYDPQSASYFMNGGGSATLRIVGHNTGGPGSAGVQIIDPSGADIFNTRDLPHGHEGGNADGQNGYGGDGSVIQIYNPNREIITTTIAGGGAGGWCWQGAGRPGGAGGGGGSGQDGSVWGGGGGGNASIDGAGGAGHSGVVYISW